jgi:hypothetical protein
MICELLTSLLLSDPILFSLGAIRVDNVLAPAKLFGYFVCLGGESDKKFRSLDRKFGSRPTITSAGGGGNLGGRTSTGIEAGGPEKLLVGHPNGDAQPESAAAQASNNAIFISFDMLQILLVLK